jgi:hypothetical protein
MAGWIDGSASLYPSPPSSSSSLPPFLTSFRRRYFDSAIPSTSGHITPTSQRLNPLRTNAHSSNFPITLSQTRTQDNDMSSRRRVVRSLYRSSLSALVQPTDQFYGYTDILYDPLLAVKLTTQQSEYSHQIRCSHVKLPPSFVLRLSFRRHGHIHRHYPQILHQPCTDDAPITVVHIPTCTNPVST